MDQCTEAVTPSPLHCLLAASRAAEPELNLPDGKLRSSLGHCGGWHLLPWTEHAGEVVGLGEPPRQGNVLSSLKVFFIFHLCCVSF